MSVTITINNGPSYNEDSTGGGPLTLRLRGASQDSFDIGGGHNCHGQGGSDIDRLLKQLGVPESLRPLLAKALGGMQGGDGLPSATSAVGTMQQFQRDNNIKLLSYDQMKEMADKGTLDGKAIPGNNPEGVRDAARAYTANHGALFDYVESATNGKHDSQLSAGDGDKVDLSKYAQPQQGPSGIDVGAFLRGCLGGHISPNKPEEYDAVKTMEKFQKDNDIKLLSYDQMKEMADKGTLNGKPIPGQDPEGTREAAQTYMENNGALFKKVEAATTGTHDSQLSAGDAGQAVNKGLVDVPPLSENQAVGVMEKFQKDNKIGLVSYDQMKEMAEKGTLNGKPIPGENKDEVRAAAQAYMAQNGALFDKMEAATDGKHDSQLGAGDPEQGRKKGFSLSDEAPEEFSYNGNGNGNGNRDIVINLGNGNGNGGYGQYGQHEQYGGHRPSSGMGDTQAVETMEKFQKDNKIGLVSYDQMKEMAEKGTLNGKEIPGENKAQVREAAQAYMAQNGALFDKMEAATDGKHDSQLGAGDPDQARNKGLIGMSDGKAVDLVQKFQKDNGIKSLSYDQVKEIADKGTFNGQPILGQNLPELQNAAARYMANNGALFDKVESAKTGEHDSVLSAEDADSAHEKGLVNA